MDSLPIIPLLSIYTIINNKNTIHYREFQKKYGLLSGTMTETDYFFRTFSLPLWKVGYDRCKKQKSLFYSAFIFITFAPVRIGVRRHETKNIRPASADRHTRTPRTFQPTRLMGEQNVIRLRGVTIYHTDDPFGSRSEKKLLQQGELILSDLNFDINAGEFVYLIGRVGSGKSSLLKTLYAELQLIEGEGYVAGFDLRKLKRRDIPMLRRRIGIVFQDYQLLTDRNVFMNLYYVMKATGWKKRIRNPQADRRGTQGRITGSQRLQDAVRGFPAANSSVWSSPAPC